MAVPLFGNGATLRRQYLEFNGQSSKDYLLYLSGPGVYDSPAPDVEATSIPGLNGDLIQNNAKSGMRRFNNVDITYKAFFFNGLPAKTAAVKSWLLSPTGYCKLADTYDPDFFRMGMCTSALTFDLSNQKAAEMKLTFNCKPQRWSVAGQEAAELEPTAQRLSEFINLIEFANSHNALNTGYYLDAAGVEVESDLGIVATDYLEVENGTYLLSGAFGSISHDIAVLETAVLYFFDSEKVLLETRGGLAGSASSSYQRTMPEGTVYIRFQYEQGYEDSIDTTVCGLVETIPQSAVTNPYEFAALPLITVEGTATEDNPALLTIGDCEVVLYNLADCAITLNCETQNAYRSDGTFCNDQIYAEDFPTLEPGDNIIQWDDGISSVTITPRWWTL